jgi:hypothetical protein
MWLWDLYAWLWSTLPLVAFLITGLLVIFAIAVLTSVFEPRHYMSESAQIVHKDPPRPAPRAKTIPPVLIDERAGNIEAPRIPKSEIEPQLPVQPIPRHQHKDPGVWMS